MLVEPGNQFSLTRAALSTCGRAEIKFLSLLKPVSIVSTLHAGRLEGASDKPEFEAIRPKTAPGATHCTFATCRSVTWKDLLLARLMLKRLSIPKMTQGPKLWVDLYLYMLPISYQFNN